MTRGKGIYDDEEGSQASGSDENGKDPESDTPDVDKNADEPTA